MSFFIFRKIDDLEAVREELRKPVIDPRVPVEIAWSPRLDSTLTVICGVGPDVGYAVFFSLMCSFCVVLQ